MCACIDLICHYLFLILLHYRHNYTLFNLLLITVLLRDRLILCGNKKLLQKFSGLLPVCYINYSYNKVDTILYVMKSSYGYQLKKQYVL
jgi:hypothetical protein